jgi:hypothetical protein
MTSPSFFAELKRRNVYKVAIAYTVTAWLLIQAASILFPTFEAPGLGDEGVCDNHSCGISDCPCSGVGLFELTPEGIKRTEDHNCFAIRPYRPCDLVFSLA